MFGFAVAHDNLAMSHKPSPSTPPHPTPSQKKHGWPLYCTYQLVTGGWFAQLSCSVMVTWYDTVKLNKQGATTQVPPSPQKAHTGPVRDVGLYSCHVHQSKYGSVCWVVMFIVVKTSNFPCLAPQKHNTTFCTELVWERRVRHTETATFRKTTFGKHTPSAYHLHGFETYIGSFWTERRDFHEWRWPALFPN